MCLSIKVERPDDVLAEGREEGFEWVVVNNGNAHRCGYVKVEPGHPWFGKGWDELPDIDVHGGITFASPDVQCDKGGPDNGWWLGFDCCHSGDAPDPDLPGYVDFTKLGAFPPMSRMRDVVRTQRYVEGECRRLCRQATNAVIPDVVLT